MRIAAALLILGLFVSGCAPLSRARALDPAAFRVPQDRAVVLVSLGVSDDFTPTTNGLTKFVMHFYRYDLEEQRALGSCTERRIAILAEIPATPGARQLLAFEAQPGAYVISPFLNTNLDGGQALIAEDGRVTSFGHIELEQQTSQGTLRSRTSELQTLGVDVPAEITAAERRSVTPPHIFICTP